MNEMNENTFYAIVHNQGEMETSPDDCMVIQTCYKMYLTFNKDVK